MLTRLEEYVAYQLHMKPESMDTVFQALAYQARRRVLDIVKSSPGVAVGVVCAQFSMSRIAVLKHIRVLEEAGLLIGEKQGREHRLFFNVTPIQVIHDRWSDEYSGFWAGAMADLKYRVEHGGESRSIKKKPKPRRKTTAIKTRRTGRGKQGGTTA